MRIYISKQEGILIQQILSHELMTILTLNQIVDTKNSKRCDSLDTIIERIEMCLQKQKSGYNRKEK